VPLSAFALTDKLPFCVSSLAYAPLGIHSFGLLYPVLTIFFITASSVVVTYVCAKAYARERLLGVLFLGCGALVFGWSSLITALLFGSSGIPAAASVLAPGALLSGLFHLACAMSTRLGFGARISKGYHAPLWLSVAALSVVLIAAASLLGLAPTFYSSSAGATAVGDVTLVAAVLEFGCSSALEYSAFQASGSRVLFWYTASLLATTIGLAGVLLSGGQTVSVAMRLGWVALFVGGVLLLLSVVWAERLSGGQLAGDRAPGLSTAFIISGRPQG